MIWLIHIIQAVPRLQKFVMKAMYVTPVFAVTEMAAVRAKEPKGKKRLNHQLKELEFVGFLGLLFELTYVWHLVDNIAGLKRLVIDATVVVDRNGHTSRKESCSDMEIRSLDQAEKQLALELPSKIKLDFLRPPRYPSCLRSQGFGISRALGL
ncbi:hypothetical protein OROHE_005953 [Orobanche hederae]